MNRIVTRILGELGEMELLDKLTSLPGADLNSLLLELFSLRAENTPPADLLKTYKSNRFAIPSEIDPVRYHAAECEILSLAMENGIDGVLLSPAAPFASCSSFGCVDQNNVVSAVRGAEVLSDPTNMLALIIADRLKSGEYRGRDPLHLCATARVLRAQAFPRVKGFYPHFGLFCIVSSGRDTGSYACEKELLTKQLSYYRSLLIKRHGAGLSLVLRSRGGYTDSDGFFERMAEHIHKVLPSVPITLDLDNSDNMYYRGINFKMYMDTHDGKTEIGDGGFVDWITQMTGSKKERCLISGIGLDRFIEG